MDVKVDSGRESDISDHDSDDKETMSDETEVSYQENMKEKNKQRKVVRYSYWTHYL